MTEAEPAMVYCVLCIEGAHDIGKVHIFSSPEKRAVWVDAETSSSQYIHYDYLVDHPERMLERAQ